jgi:Dolichyl-phosphate-mannose-protein mannosyltransferase
MDTFTTSLVAKPLTTGATCPALRSQELSAEAFWDRLSFGIIVLGAVLALLTFRDYGVTWDEDAHNWYGNFVLDYYVSFFTDRNALHWRDLYNYGAIFDTAAAALNRVSPIGTYETRHLLNALVGVLGLAGCYKLGHAIGGARVGFLATFFLLLTPNYYGQMFNNPKDIPFAVGMVWATYYMVRMVPALPRPPLGLLAKLGVAIGMTMGVRIGGLLLLCYLGLLLALDGGWRTIVARRPVLLLDIAWTSFWRVLLPVLLVAYPVMLVFWPWGQTDPIENPLRALAFFSHQNFPFTTLFAGRFVPASNLPWTYLPTHIALALPELILVLLLCALILCGFALARGRTRISRTQVLMYVILSVGVVFPVAFAIAIKAVLFDGMRHFLFVLPLAAVASALVASQGLTRLVLYRYRKPIYVVIALYGLAHVSVMTMLHPDQYVYYNSFVGGVAGAEQKFKLDYWANSYAEAVQGLEDYLRAAYGPDFEEREFTVAVCGPPISADYYFPANFRFTRQLSRADFFVAFTKDNCDRSLPGRPVYQVERMGALLSVVLDRRDCFSEKRTARRPLAAVLSGLPPNPDPP